MNLLAAANLLSSHNSRQAQQQSDHVVEQAQQQEGEEGS